MDIHAVQFTDSKRKEWRARAEADPFFFATSIIGYTDMREIHENLLKNLAGVGSWGLSWYAALVCWARGFLKSSTVRSWVLWKALHCDSWSSLVFSSSEEKAQEIYIRPISKLFRDSDLSDFLNWLYADRIPKGFAEWHTGRIAFLSKDPNAPPSIQAFGIEKAPEGHHVRAIVVDDPEGADAEKTGVPNASAQRFIANARTMLIEHTDQVVVVGTPHGLDPTVYWIRNMEAGGSLDNSKREAWMLSWIPIINDQGEPNYPHRFPAEAVAKLRILEQGKDVFWTQRMLMPPRALDSFVDVARVRRHAYTFVRARKAIRYRVQAEERTSEGVSFDGGHDCVAPISSMRIYAHFDPKHRERTKIELSNREPAHHAIAIVGVYFDLHAFLLESWSRECSIHDACHQLYRLYQRWAFFELTVEATGAQVWVRPILQLLEKSFPALRNVTRQSSMGHKYYLPPLSSRVREVERGSASKESVHRELLAPLLEGGYFHLPRDGEEEAWRQIEGMANPILRKDILDAIAQGPGTSQQPGWRPPLPQESEDAALLVAAVKEQARIGVGAGYGPKRLWGSGMVGALTTRLPR